MPKKYNTALDFIEKASKVRVYPYMSVTDFAKLTPELKQQLVGKGSGNPSGTGNGNGN